MDLHIAPDEGRTARVLLHRSARRVQIDVDGGDDEVGGEASPADGAGGEGRRRKRGGRKRRGGGGGGGAKNDLRRLMATRKP